MKRGAPVGPNPVKPNREPFEKKWLDLHKELVRVQKSADNRVEKIRKDSQVLVDTAQAAKTNAEFALAEFMTSRTEAALLHLKKQRGWFGRVWFRLWYLLTGRII